MEKIQIFPALPGMQADDITIGEVVSCGPSVYQIPLYGTKKCDYDKYLCILEQEGYEKYAETENGLGETVYAATLTKDAIVLTVCYMKKQNQTILTIGYGLQLSPYLHAHEVAERRVEENAKTRIHMMELWWFGNGFIIQLKNGHFVISDGGLKSDAKYLVDYLESLAPEGEKPVIEAWTITHAHADHCGVMTAFAEDKAFASRVFVEGIYFSEGSEQLHKRFVSGLSDIAGIKKAAKRLRTTEGLHPEIYRPQTGQRYYFSDITMDIVHCQEQLPIEQYECQDYAGDYNDSSTWYMFTIEGQKVLFTGDGDVGSMKVMMNTYEKEYLDVDIMTLPHHGFNTWDTFTDYCKVKTLLVTAKDRLPVRRDAENAYLKSQVEEWIAGWGEGTIVLNFPYKQGTYETIPTREWIYHEGIERKEAPSLGTLPKK